MIKEITKEIRRLLLGSGMLPVVGKYYYVSRKIFSSFKRKNPKDKEETE